MRSNYVPYVAANEREGRAPRGDRSSRGIDVAGLAIIYPEMPAMRASAAKTRRDRLIGNFERSRICASEGRVLIQRSGRPPNRVI